MNALQTRPADSSKRQLGAILFADIVGYSKLMSQDEIATHHSVGQSLELFEAKSAEYGGIILDQRGDSALVLFDSAVAAVELAVAIQEQFEKVNPDVAEERQIRFRIGINVGEVLRDQRGVHGDSVNIAARLESIADPGSIFISSAVHDLIRTKLSYGYEYVGSKALKNIAEPVDVYRVRSEVDGATMAPSIRTHANKDKRLQPDIPSIVVLPFQNQGAGNSGDWLAEGITEDITVNLSKFKNLFVISRNSAFLFRDTQVQPQDAARQLGRPIRHPGTDSKGREPDSHIG